MNKRFVAGTIIILFISSSFIPIISGGRIVVDQMESSESFEIAEYKEEIPITFYTFGKQR